MVRAAAARMLCRASRAAPIVAEMEIDRSLSIQSAYPLRSIYRKAYPRGDPPELEQLQYRPLKAHW